MEVIWVALLQDLADGALALRTLANQNCPSIPQPLERANREELEEVALMLMVRAMILARDLPLKDCGRVTLLVNLADRLEAAIPRLVERISPETTSFLWDPLGMEHRISAEEIDLLAAALEQAARAA